MDTTEYYFRKLPWISLLCLWQLGYVCDSQRTDPGKRQEPVEYKKPLRSTYKACNYAESDSQSDSENDDEDEEEVSFKDVPPKEDYVVNADAPVKQPCTLCLSPWVNRGVRDYCLDEGFQAQCADDAVIVITSAHYGRMTVGRCVKRNYGYIGCHSDVLGFASKLCSGKRSCSITNFAATFDPYLSCPADLKAYMEVSYECVQVVTGHRYACQSPGGLSVPRRTGYLASIVTEERGLGSSRCPWVITALPGQRVNVSVVDFSLAASSRGQSPSSSSSHADASRGTGQIMPRYCREYAVLRDKGSSRSVVVCNGDSRQKHIYISESNSYTIEVQTSEGQETPSRFLLRYEVIGCPLPETPHNAHIRGTWDTIVIQCNFTNEDWTLTCVDGVWHGEYGNCSTGVATNSEEITSSAGFLPLGITVVIIVGVALLICITTLIVGLIHLRRKRNQEAAHVRQEEALLYGTARPGEIKAEPPQGGGPRFATIDRTKTYSPIPAGRGRPGGTGGEYTHIWEVRRPPQVLLPSGVDDPHHHHFHHHPSCHAHHHHTLDGRSPPGRAVPTCMGTLPLTKADRASHPGGGGGGPADPAAGGGTNYQPPGDGATLRRDPKSRGSFITFKPTQRDEHIYQSPELLAERVKQRTPGIIEPQQQQQQAPHTCTHGQCGAADAPFYFELDPKQGSKLVALNTSCSLPHQTAAGGEQQHFHNSSC